MTEEQKAVLHKAEELKRAIKEMEVEYDTLKEQLLDIVPDEAKIDTGIGIFTKETRLVWTYSESTTKMADELKEKQKQEQQLGVAVSKPGAVFIKYKAKKNT